MAIPRMDITSRIAGDECFPSVWRLFFSRARGGHRGVSPTQPPGTGASDPGRPSAHARLDPRRQA
jgi:hypothetical protein